MANNAMLQQLLAGQGQGVPVIDTGENGLTYYQRQAQEQMGQSMLAQARMANVQAQQAGPTAFTPGTMSGGALYAPTADAGLSGQMGPMIRDANGVQLQTPDALNNQASAANAAQGFQVGEKNKDQQQADMMGQLAGSINKLPKDQQHLAYERGMGILLGKGVVSFDEAPPWDKGGRELLQHIADQKSSTELGVANANAQARIGEANINAQAGNQQAAIKAGLMNPQAATQSGDVEAQMKGIVQDPSKSPLEKEQAIGVLSKMGLVGGPGQPVGDPISARAATKYTGAAEAIKDIDELGGLLKSNPDMSILGAKAYKAGGLNRLLGPEQQRFNTLTTDLNDFIHSQGGEGGLEKNKIDKLTSLLPTVGDNSDERMKKLENLRTEYVRLQTASDPSGHIQRNLEKQGLVDPRDKLPDAAAATAQAVAQVPSNNSMPHGLSPQQAQALIALRRQQSTPILQKGDRLDYFQ